MHYSDEEIEILLQSTNFPTLKNDRILKAARGESPDKLPIWIMRQAGRYMEEFREFRKLHSFFDICQTPKLACEVTLMPIHKYELDASIIFSDILVIPQALGMECIMQPEKGPVFPKPLTLETLKDLTWESALDSLVYVGHAVRLTRHALEGKVPLLGFSAAPWTLMCYMIEGGGTKTASKAKKWLYSHQSEARDLIDKLSFLIENYLVMQVEYGAQMLQLFESSAEYLGSEIYKEFMTSVIIRIRQNVRSKLKEKKLDDVPMIFFAKGGGHFLDQQIQMGFEVLSIDWVTNPSQARKIAKDITLQGNLDPCALYANKDLLVKYVQNMLKEFGYHRYIVNLGHGIYPDAPTEAVKWFIDAVHDFKC